MVRDMANHDLALLLRSRKEIQDRLDRSPRLQQPQTRTLKRVNVTFDAIRILAGLEAVKRVCVSEKLQVVVSIDHMLARVQE